MITVSKRFKKPLTAVAVGVIVCLVTLALRQSGLLALAELKTLDHRYQLYADPAKAGQDLVLVAVDEASLEAYGRWPWPRDRHGYAVQFLKDAGAKAIIFDILFLEPDDNAEEFDQSFAEHIRRAGNVFLPTLLDVTADSAAAPHLLAKATIHVSGESRRAVAVAGRYQGVKFPIPPLAEAARGLGYINFFPDADGTTRRLPLLASWSDGAFLQLASAVARHLLDADQAVLGRRTLRLGPAMIPLTAEGDMVIDWHGSLERHTYPAYSMGAVLRSYSELQKGQKPSLDPALFRGKIVFIATTAAGTYDLRVTPLSPFTPGVLIHMAALDNILRGRSMQPAPYWVFAATTFALCLGTACGFMLLQRQAAKIGLIAGLAAGYYGLAVHAFTTHGLWLELAFPEGALAMTYAVAATVEYLTEGRQRRVLRAVFDKYMAAEVVDEIMRNPEGIKLGGARNELSVLFSDIAGFTSISEELEPETLVEFLNQYLSAMTDVILKHRGNVNKYLGDGIMAIFGAPRGDPNHATLACYAALESQETLVRLREEWKAQGYPEIVARIGINSGPIVVGNVGSQARMEYTVMGDNVNLASRLEGANKYYDTLILLGPRTYELARGEIEAREVDLLRVKGKREPVVVYELLSRKGMLALSKRQAVGLYHEGLAAYKRRDFPTAERLFQEALAQDPSDGPSRVYLSRTRTYLADPPPPEWDGVYELTTK